MAKIKVLSHEITVASIKEEDYISLTDIARYKNQDRSDDLIRNWLRNRNTLEFLGIWEHLNNPGFRIQAGLNSFTLTPKQWIEKTGAIGIVSKAGRYGGTYAHKDIAFEFASWVSVEFKLYLIMMQRKKMTELSAALPYACTEQGVSMLSAVLCSETAVKVSIQIIKAFIPRSLLEYTSLRP